MSRIGKQPIKVSQGVEVFVTPEAISVKGHKGELSLSYRSECIDVVVNDSTVNVTRNSDDKGVRALHG